MTAALQKRFKRFVIVLELLWLIVVVGVASHNIQQRYDDAEHFALVAADESLQKDITYRKWNAGHGGVYVPVTEATQPNPYLDVPNRELHTAEGITLTKLNPAYMTRQVHEMSALEFGSKGHITSLEPIRPANAPDEWERSALNRMEQGRERVHEVVTWNGGTYMRVIIPLFAEEGCLKCHAAQGYELNDLRGGLSASVPMERYLTAARSNSITAGLMFFFLWIIGGVGIMIAGRSLRLSIDRHLTSEEALRKSEQRLTDLVNTTEGIVWELDLDSFCFTFVSNYAVTLLGHSKDEWYRPDFWLDNLHPEDKEEAARYCMAQTEKLQPHSFEYRFRKKDGSYLWLRDLVTVFAENGEAKALRGVLIDIDEHKRRILQLQQYEAVVESSDKLIAVVDEQYRYVLVNKRFLDWHSLTRDDVLGKTATEILGKKSFDKLLPSIERCFKGEEVVFEFEIPYQHQQGKVVEVIYRPVWSNGKISSVAAIISDITQTREYESNLKEALHAAEEAGKAKNIFLANMSHEIRTPLNGVLGMLQLMEDTALTSDQTEYLKTATTSGWNLLELLNDILDLSKIDAGKVDLGNAPFDLNILIEKINIPFAQTIKEKKLLFQATINANTPRIVLGDARRLRQILQNILGNAVKFTQEGGISLTVCQRDVVDENRAIIEFMIADSGVGIPKRIQERLFDPFVQGDSSYAKEYQGAGLGLGIVRKLIDAMGGTVSLHSMEGGGTTFTLQIPLELPEGSQEIYEPVEATASPSPAMLKILIAEDNKINQMMLQRMLKKAGHQVMAVENGREAVDYVRDYRPDIVFMDIQMPEMDGIAATKEIRSIESAEKRAATPIVALTAYAMLGDKEKFLGEGMDAYLPKPISKRQIIQLIAELTQGGD